MARPLQFSPTMNNNCRLTKVANRQPKLAAGVLLFSVAYLGAGLGSVAMLLSL